MVTMGVGIDGDEAFGPVEIRIEIVEPGHTKDNVEFVKRGGDKIEGIVIGID